MDQPVVPEFMPVAFVFPTAALRPQGRCQTPRRCPKCLRLSHADALSESRGVPALSLETGLQRFWCSIMWLLASNGVRGEF